MRVNFVELELEEAIPYYQSGRKDALNGGSQFQTYDQRSLWQQNLNK